MTEQESSNSVGSRKFNWQITFFLAYSSDHAK